MRPVGLREMFVIISMDNDLGRRRRDGLDLGVPYDWSRGVPPEEVPDFVRHRWRKGRFGKERSERLMGAFAAHLRAWEALAELGSPEAIILEDDAKLLRPVPADLPQDTVTLLGGVFKGWGAWNTPDQLAWERGEFLETCLLYTSPSPRDS